MTLENLTAKTWFLSFSFFSFSSPFFSKRNESIGFDFDYKQNLHCMALGGAVVVREHSFLQGKLYYCINCTGFLLFHGNG